GSSSRSTCGPWPFGEATTTLESDSGTIPSSSGGRPYGSVLALRAVMHSNDGNRRSTQIQVRSGDRMVAAVHRSDGRIRRTGRRGRGGGWRGRGPGASSGDVGNAQPIGARGARVCRGDAPQALRAGARGAGAGRRSTT